MEKRKERAVMRKRAFNCNFWAFSGVSRSAETEGPRIEGERPEKNNSKKRHFLAIYSKNSGKKGYSGRRGEEDKT